MSLGQAFQELVASRKLLAQMAFILSAIIAMALLLTPEDERLNYHFVQEDGFATVLSSFFLAAAAAFAFVYRQRIDRADSASYWTWSVFALGFAFLAIDEVFQIHEQIGWLLHESVDSGPFRNWNDVVVIAYGVIAIPIIWMALPKLLPHKRLVILFALGFAAYGAHTITDTVVEDASTLSTIIEESFKLACVMCLSFGMWTGLSEKLNG